MAQEASNTGGQVRQLLTAKNLAVSLPAAGNTTLLEVATAGLDQISVQVDVTVHALDGFVIQGRVSKDGAFFNLYTTGYTSPTGLLLAASGDLTAQAASSTGWFILDVRSLYAVRVLASGASDGTLVDIYAGGEGH